MDEGEARQRFTLWKGFQMQDDHTEDQHLAQSVSSRGSGWFPGQEQVVPGQSDALLIAFLQSWMLAKKRNLATAVQC